MGSLDQRRMGHGTEQAWAEFRWTLHRDRVGLWCALSDDGRLRRRDRCSLQPASLGDQRISVAVARLSEFGGKGCGY